jgi:hypothetical protein
MICKYECVALLFKHRGDAAANAGRFAILDQPARKPEEP